TDFLIVARARVPAFLARAVVTALRVAAVVVVAAAVAAAAREVEVVLHLARAHLLEVAGTRVPALAVRVRDGARAVIRVVGVGALVIDLRRGRGGGGGEDEASCDGGNLHGWYSSG